MSWACSLCSCSFTPDAAPGSAEGRWQTRGNFRPSRYTPLPGSTVGRPLSSSSSSSSGNSSSSASGGARGGRPRQGTLQQGRRGGRSGAAAAAAGAPTTFHGALQAEQLSLGVVAARFNSLVTKPLLEGALEGIERHGGDTAKTDVVWVPGSFELPVVARAMARSGNYDAVIAIGAVVRGATTHYEAVVNAATSGLLAASTDTGVPVTFCVLTCDTMEQALDRAGGKAGNKGFEAAATAIETANVLAALRGQGKAAPAWAQGQGQGQAREEGSFFLDQEEEGDSE